MARKKLFVTKIVTFLMGFYLLENLSVNIFFKQIKLQMIWATSHFDLEEQN
jgi:hypothetical protein